MRTPALTTGRGVTGDRGDALVPAGSGSFIWVSFEQGGLGDHVAEVHGARAARGLLRPGRGRAPGENYVGTEHLLLGLVRENDSVAARILDRLGVPLGRIRSDIERQVTRGHGNLGQDMQLTPRAKRVIDLAYEEARQLNNNYIGTEHLLLGLIREGDGLAAPRAGQAGRGPGADPPRGLRDAGRREPAEPQPSSRSRTPTLDEFGRDLTELARNEKLDPVVGRHNGDRAGDPDPLAAASRTTRVSSARRASARPPSPRGWRSGSSARTSPSR